MRDEVARTVQIVMPSLPGKAFAKQLPFINSDDGIFEVEFIEERRRGLEVSLKIKHKFGLNDDPLRNSSTK